MHRLALAAALALAGTSQAAELQPATIVAFDRYVRATEAQREAERRSGKFLRTANGPEVARLRSGEVVVQQLGAAAVIEVPEGLIHHWLGAVFIPGVTLQQTLAALQDFDNHHKVYAPEVVSSRLLQRKGDDFQIFLRLRKKKVVTVVLDTEYDVHFAEFDRASVYSRSYSRRIAEVEDAGGSRERHVPEGKGHGFLWRLYTYWRIRETAQGVDVECEAISLTRDVPTGLGWLVKPFVESVPRESLTFTLEATRRGLLGTNVSTGNLARRNGGQP